MGLFVCSIPQQRSGHRFYLDINLELGSLILGRILSRTKSYGAETLTVLRADPDNDLGDPKEQMTRYNQDPSWDAEIAVFEDALRSMQLVSKI